MLHLTGDPLSWDSIHRIVFAGEEVALAPSSRAAMSRSRAVVEKIIAEGRTVYGVNTGFGRLSDVRIPDEDLVRLQINLVRSHACGVGSPMSVWEVRAMLLLRANVLAIGLSGARPEVAEHLVSMLNSGIHPVIPSKGSVGASGDLAPLAHLAMGAIGEGIVEFEGDILPSAEAHAKAELIPLKLQAKEGLALLNGTQAMTALGLIALTQAKACLDVADQAGAMTLEALKGTPSAFDPRIHEARRAPHQVFVANRLLELLDDSEIRRSHLENDNRVQDAYAIRCMPQVHGAARSAIEFVESTLLAETGAATDNPLVFAETEEVISGGNFHGAPIAAALDFAAIALTDLASISERRIDRLVNPDSSEGLPPFLTADAGTSSGFMIAHVTAAALVNECKVLSHPASVDSIPTSGGKEDHVSMGMTSALKLQSVVENLSHVLAIELLAASTGIEFRRPLRAGKGVEAAYETVRELVPPVTEDRSLSEDIELIASAMELISGR